MRSYSHLFLCQGKRASPSVTEIETVVRKKEQDEVPRQNIQQKEYRFVQKIWECDWSNLFKADVSV